MSNPEISFVIPWYRKLEWFRLALPHNAAMFCANAEVVLCLDDPSETAMLLALVKMFQHIRFVVVVNPGTHDWRPPCCAINVGIRHAIGSKVVIISPETVLKLPRPDYLKLKAENSDGLMRTGLSWNIEMHAPDGNLLHQRLQDYDKLWPAANFGYGFLLCEKWCLEAIRGFDESRKGWGMDDTDARMRLMKLGIRQIVDPRIHAVHPWHPTEAGRIGGEGIRVEAVLHDQPDWGKAFNNVVWDWKKQ